MIVAEVTKSGERWQAVNRGFRPLANYIFAKERSGDKIAMTAPVTQQREKIAMTAPVTQSRAPGPDEQWRVRFIMPSGYSLDRLPTPTDRTVTLRKVEAARQVAIRFSGVATDELIREQEAKLTAWLARERLLPNGPPTYAYYNDPFTPGFLRRNEVMFELAPAAR